jgi:hypothetical protein
MSRKVRIVLNVSPAVATFLKERARANRVTLQRALLGARLDNIGRERPWTRRAS